MTNSNPTGALVNSIYPLSYFTLAGVDEIQFPDKFWWSSKERYAAVDLSGFNYLALAAGGSPTSEIIEIDLGRVREINYLNFDINRAPINITIEYDALSTPNRDPIWKTIQPVSDSLPFENSISFDPRSRNAWQNVEYQFADEFGQLVHTRYIRITFTRRDEKWPTAASPAFQWPIFVKHLRLARYIEELLDTAGSLLNQDTPSDLVSFVIPNQGVNTTTEVRQQFVIPASQVRGNDNVVPDILGFGVLVTPNIFSTDIALVDVASSEIVLQWTLYDVTNPATAPVKVASGTTDPHILSTKEWIDFYLDPAKVITGSTGVVYELRVQSTNETACNIVYTHTPNSLSSTSIPGTLTFTNNSATVNTTLDLRSTLKPGQYIALAGISDQPLLVSAIGASTLTLSSAYAGATVTTTASVIYPFTSWNGSAYVQDASKNLVIRVWADVADEGKDILGNTYRYLVRRQEADSVFDAAKAGWMSAPAPTPDAVEALYFDVRGTKAGSSIFSSIQAVQIAPRTPGVRMNVYYSQENLNGNPPVTNTEWDNLLWMPVQQTYTLHRNEIIQLPSPINAAYIKLEFTALKPLPFRLPTWPPLPPRRYRRFPTWVENVFGGTGLKNVVEDWFLRNSTPIEQKVLQQIANPVKEYEYKQAEFMAQLALGAIGDEQTVNSGLVDVANKAMIDTTTGSKIFINPPAQYGSPLLVSVDQSSILGKMTVLTYDTSKIDQPVENQDNPIPGSDIPVVSTVNDRLTQSYQSLAQFPMRFYKPTRHIYTIEEAEFNKTAYFVGIDSVRFLRIDYGKTFDDLVLTESLYDDILLVENTWARESETTIPDGAIVYITYQIGDSDTIIADEQAILSGFVPYTLQTSGTARNILVFGAPAQQGAQYFQGLDFQLGYTQDSVGDTVTFIERSNLAARLTVPLQPLQAQDSFTVIGKARIPTVSQDSGAVISVGVPTGTDIYIP